jgi:outer membrane biosynthesis protein TonB
MKTIRPYFLVLLAMVAVLMLWSCEGQQPSTQEKAPPAAEQPATKNNGLDIEQPASEPQEPSRTPVPETEEGVPSEPAPEAQPEAQKKEDEPAPETEEQLAPRPEPKPQAQPKPEPETTAQVEEKPSAVAVPADPMLLTAPEGTVMKQAPVAFSHKRHSALECTACHHTWDGQGAIGGCMDQGCHDLTDAKTPQERKDPTYFYNAFHSRGSEISCVGCHGEMRKAGQPTGPVGCQECHPKQ